MAKKKEETEVAEAIKKDFKSFMIFSTSKKVEEKILNGLVDAALKSKVKN